MTTSLATTDTLDIAALEARLTMRELDWINAYIGEAKGNAAHAARLAGYSGTNQDLASYGYALLIKPHIKAVVQAHLTAIGITRETLLLQMLDIIQHDAFSPDGTPTMRLIKRMTDTIAKDMHSRSYEAYDKIEAAKVLSRLAGWDVKTVEHTQRRPILVKHIHQSETVQAPIDTTYRELSTSTAPNVSELSTYSSTLDATTGANESSSGSDGE